MIRPGDLETRAPHTGESLDGYVTQMAHENWIMKVARLSRYGGVRYAHQPNLSTRGWDELPALAAILNVQTDDLRERAYPCAAIDPNRRTFFGTSVQRSDLRLSSRYFAPSRLGETGYHHALWQLRFPFDYDNGELLTNECPRCGAVQRWRHTVGVRYCDVRVCDLSDAPMKRLTPELANDVKPLLGLVHPDSAIRAGSIAELPDRFRSTDPGLVLELILRLCPVAHPEFRWSRGSRWWDNEPVTIAEGIARARPLIDDWPNRMRERCSNDLVRGEARFGDGNGGTTRKFFRHRDGGDVNDFVAAAVRELHHAMDINGTDGPMLRQDTIGVKEAGRMLGITESQASAIRRNGGFRTIAVMRGAIMVPHFDRFAVASIVPDIKRRADLSSFIEALGMPLYGLEQIVAMEDLDHLDHPYFAVRYRNIQTTKEAVSHFVFHLTSNASPVTDTMIPLHEGLRTISGIKPFGTIVHAMLNGHADYAVDLHSTKPLAARISIEAEALDLAIAAGFSGGSRKITFSDVISKRDAGVSLNIGTRESTALFSDLPKGMAPVVKTSLVDELAREFITPLEMSARMGRSVRHAVQTAAAAGIERLSPAGYLRDIVERRIDLVRNDCDKR